MRFLSREAYLHEGEFRVDLNTLCRCKIGLVDIILPNINQKHKDNNCIDIYCDQIDSNFDNPKRLLKRLYFESVGETQRSNIWEAKIINFQPVDSDDKYLTFKVRRSYEGTIPQFRKHAEKPKIFLTLAIINEPESRWACV